MSHFFISYSHQDDIHLARLLNTLQAWDYNEADIWFDRHIDTGDNWRDEIASALNEASALIFLMTNQSIRSIYCSYEWAYAMGYGSPILPLLFEEIQLSEIPVPLSTYQHINCLNGIPPSLEDQLKQLHSTPPQVKVIEQKVFDIIYGTHRRYHILWWLNQKRIDWHSFDPTLPELTIDYFARKAATAHEELTELMLEKAVIFKGRLYRNSWLVADFLKEFSRLRQLGGRHLDDQLLPRYQREWLPTFLYFDQYDWAHGISRYFDLFPEEFIYYQNVFRQIVEVFSVMGTQDIEILLHQVQATYHRR